MVGYSHQVYLKSNLVLLEFLPWLGLLQFLLGGTESHIMPGLSEMMAQTSVGAAGQKRMSHTRSLKVTKPLPYYVCFLFFIFLFPVYWLNSSSHHSNCEQLQVEQTAIYWHFVWQWGQNPMWIILEYSTVYVYETMPLKQWDTEMWYKV